MARLDLSLLGAFCARLDGRALSGFVSDKARALLAYLAVEADRPHRREELAALLWPDNAPASARANLSQALFNLRSLLGDRGRAGDPPDEALPFLAVSGQTLQLEPTSDHAVDVLVDRCRAALRLLCEGKSDAQIVAFYVERYSRELTDPSKGPQWVADRARTYIKIAKRQHDEGRRA